MTREKVETMPIEQPPTTCLAVGAPQRRPATARWRVLCAALVTLLASVAVANAADPFYEGLLRKGTDQYNRREFAAAARSLRIACFGLLDEPELLADALTRLALSQAASGDASGFRDTYHRISDVEQRFQAYTRAAIPDDARKAFEDEVKANIPEATLAADPAFARLVPKPEERVAQLPLKERRKELQRLTKSEPKEEKWWLMLATTELADGNEREAWQAADSAVKLAPTDKSALRLRGLAFAADRRWEQAVPDLTACGTANTDAVVGEALLRSLVELKRWQQAADLFGEMPVESKKAEPVKELGDRVAAAMLASKAAEAKPTPRATATATPRPKPTSTATVTPSPKPKAASATPTPTRPMPTATPTPTKPPATPPPPSQPPAAPTYTAAPARPSPQPTLPAAARKELSQAEKLADQGKTAEAFSLAKKVAEANPSSTEALLFAAEMAYRGARWSDALAYFKRAGDPGEAQPLRLFYLAVTLYETGDRDAAAVQMRRCLPLIRNTDYVERYAAKILGPPPPTPAE